MPIISSAYRTSGAFKNCHFSTIFSAKLRITPKLIQKRERIQLDDGDFIDLDFSFSEKPSEKITVLLHGLEGNAQRTYIKGQGKVLVENGWDVCGFNYRGCSGEPNKLYKSYNAGKTDDLETVVTYLLQKERYREITLIGFSLGGNLVLKYLGEDRILPSEVTKAVVISSPLSLKGSLIALSEFRNWVYRTSFLCLLRKKYRTKRASFPNEITASETQKIKSLLDFDNAYTAPAHGFIDAYDYYEKNSCLQFLPNITIDVLILNAENDSFLSADCFPRLLASQSKNIYLEIPKFGGHVGFYQPKNLYFSETRALEFLNTNYLKPTL